MRDAKIYSGNVRVEKMRKLFLIVGIALLIACVIFTVFAALNLLGYYHVLDGSAALYGRLHQRAVVFFVAGSILAALGTACLIIHFKL